MIYYDKGWEPGLKKKGKKVKDLIRKARVLHDHVDSFYHCSQVKVSDTNVYLRDVFDFAGDRRRETYIRSEEITQYFILQVYLTYAYNHFANENLREVEQGNFTLAEYSGKNSWKRRKNKITEKTQQNLTNFAQFFSHYPSC